MRTSIRLAAPASWPRLPRPTARVRMSALYAGLFLISGMVALTVTYLLAAGHSPITIPGAPGRPVAQAQHHADLSHLLQASAIVLAAGTLGSALLGWFAAGRLLRPLQRITAAARTISATNLHERLALRGPEDEFKRLGDTLDELLARLEASFAAQRRFVANASHELRTPLTLERTLLELALADPDAPASSLRGTCEELLAYEQGQERLLEALLTLASSEGELERREPLDLSVLAKHELQTPRPTIEARSLDVESSLAPAVTSGDAALLERLIANLIDNAAQHNIPGGRIEVETGTNAAHAFVTVANSGPVIQPGEVDRLFEPFQRGDADRPDDKDGHHGLGLSIVRAIATTHDATLTAQAPPEGGLVVTVAFPKPND
jgi:signal transduction histidine kinase